MRSNRTRLVGLITLCIITSLLISPVRADEEYHVIAIMQAPTPTSGGFFGSDLALSEDLVLIAEEEADLGDLQKVGRAYIFDLEWNHVATLQQPSPKAHDVFGKSVDVWGDTIAIYSATNVEDMKWAGKVYLFDSEGVLQTTIQSPEPEIGATFGIELCLYRDILVVAESYKNDQGFLDAGVVHIFNPDGDFLRTIHSPSPINTGQFGCSIDANDEFILVAEFGDRFSAHAIPNGSVYVYNREYELVETLHSPDHQERTYFGISVAISGDHIVVGEHQASVDGHERAGRAHIYDTDWNLVATLQSPTPEDNAEFGMDVDIGGGLVVVGERKGDVVTMNEGKAYVFDLEGNLIDTLFSEPEIDAQFGWRVVTDGETIVVADGLHSVDGLSQAGYVHVFGKGEPAAEQPAPEEETTETETESEPESDKSGGIPGFPLESIVLSIVLAVLVLWFIRRQR